LEGASPFQGFFNLRPLTGRKAAPQGIMLAKKREMSYNMMTTLAEYAFA
jgi:hypothetical protein